jgi:hypothetical protein
MSYYSDNPTNCRVDFFKENGKWYATEMVVFDGKWWKDRSIDEGWTHPIDKFKEVLKEHLYDASRQNAYRMRGMIAICLDPYFEDAWPLMIRIPETGEW